ncbi:hypothetical protein RIF29_20125 [Crotalaria pallida]|uniref:PB1-like domain-containing protein n=1 Tax=Crotalaria pallida TaxID=3830 RepID=A0AAN9F3W9_CROPI
MESDEGGQTNKRFTAVLHHMGMFTIDRLEYVGGCITAAHDIEVEGWSWFEALELVRDLGYLDVVQLWWKPNGSEWVHIVDDKEAEAIANYAIENKCEVDIYVEHVQRSVPVEIVDAENEGKDDGNEKKDQGGGDGNKDQGCGGSGDVLLETNKRAKQILEGG